MTNGTDQDLLTQRMQSLSAEVLMTGVGDPAGLAHIMEELEDLQGSLPDDAPDAQELLALTAEVLRGVRAGRARDPDEALRLVAAGIAAAAAAAAADGESKAEFRAPGSAGHSQSLLRGHDRYEEGLERLLHQQAQAFRAQAQQVQELHDALQRKNTALHEVLDTIQDRQQQIVRQVVTNVETSVLPLLQALRPSLPPRQRKLLDQAISNLEELTAPFLHSLGRDIPALSPTELRICDHIRRGLSSKEIAQVEGISTGTVHRHREGIRRKLGLANTATNLTVYLQQYGQEPPSA